MGDLCTLESVKSYLKIQPGQVTDDDLLKSLITSVSRWVARKLDRELALTEYVETYSGNGAARLMLRNYPVATVDSLQIDTTAEVPERAFPGEEGYVLIPPGTIALDGGLAFTRGLANVTVDYTAGYSTIPPEVAQAAVELVALWYRNRDRVGLGSQTTAGESVTFRADEAPASVREVLQTYRRVKAS